MSSRDFEALAKRYLSEEEHPTFRGEIQELLDAGDERELAERFFADLSFGTGGLRGIIGGGTYRMNPVVVRRATQGLADYILQQGIAQPSVVLSHDNRRFSDLFALEAARVLAANGIKAYLVQELRPTPLLSFAVRYFKATAGIMVTASHNPPEYNGYKVYWSDGAQVVPPHDTGIIERVRRVTAVRSMDPAEAEKRGLLVRFGAEVDEAYIQGVLDGLIRPGVFSGAKGLPAVFTPLHGTGDTLILPITGRLGLQLSCVAEQLVHDGNFPTVTSPNPEEAAALELALRQADREGATLVLATDPDADRIGVGVKHRGEWVLLNGNQLGALLTDYVFSSLQEQGRLPPRPAFVNTIVTTDLQTLIARKYGAQTFKVLTGFKYIGEKIRDWEQHNGPQYVFGGEESYGFLYGTQVRDKDAVSTAILVLEMALHLRTLGRDLVDRLEELYFEHGYFHEVLISKSYPGVAGMQTMQAIMKKIRQHPPARFEDLETSRFIDYLKGESLPSSDVVQFLLKDGSLVTIRPSGTEPKIKIYISCKAPAGIPIQEARAEAVSKADVLRRSLEALLTG